MTSVSPFMPTLYGIKQCNTCRNAHRLLTELGIAHRVVDLRVDACDANGLLDERMLSRFMSAADWETLLNRRSTAWRSLSDAQKAVQDEATARGLLRQHPTLLKRPLLDLGDSVIIGFDKARYTALA